jgi:hypothetical protein
MRVVITRAALATAAVFALAACAPADPTARPRPIVPTLEASAWRAASVPITAATIADLDLLGRLDVLQNAATGTASTAFAHAVSPDGRALAVLDDTALTVFSLETGARVFSTGRADAVGVFFAPDGSELYTLDSAGLWSALDPATGAMRATALAADSGFTGLFAYDSVTGVFALVQQAGTIALWDAPGRAFAGQLVPPDAGLYPGAALAVAPGVASVAFARADGQITWWRAFPELAEAADANGAQAQADETAPVAASAMRAVGSFLLDTAEPLTLAFRPDGLQIAVGTTRDTRLWNDPSALPADENAVRTLDSGPAPHIVYADRADATAAPLLVGETRLTVWDAAAARLLGGLPEASGIAFDAAFSPDGAYLLTTSIGAVPGGLGDDAAAPPDLTSLWALAEAGPEGIGRADLPVNTPIVRADWTADGRLILLFSANGPVYVWGIPAPA